MNILKLESQLIKDRISITKAAAIEKNIRINLWSKSIEESKGPVANKEMAKQTHFILIKQLGTLTNKIYILERALIAVSNNTPPDVVLSEQENKQFLQWMSFGISGSVFQQFKDNLSSITLSSQKNDQVKKSLFDRKSIFNRVFPAMKFTG